MNIDINGKVRYISKENKVTSDKASHAFKIIVIETLMDSYVAVHVWNEKLDVLNEIRINDIVELSCRLESHKNKKNPNLWFHKILLK